MDLNGTNERRWINGATSQSTHKDNGQRPMGNGQANFIYSSFKHEFKTYQFHEILNLETNDEQNTLEPWRQSNWCIYLPLYWLDSVCIFILFSIFCFVIIISNLLVAFYENQSKFILKTWNPFGLFETE